MSKLISKLLRLLRSPQARTAIEQARRQAADPRNRQRIARMCISVLSTWCRRPSR